MEYKVVDLLREGEAYVFDLCFGNIQSNDHNLGQRFYSWVSEVKTFIESNYLHTSDPFILINEVDYTQFTIDESSFGLEKEKVERALKKCLYEQQYIKSKSATFLEKVFYSIMNLFK